MGEQAEPQGRRTTLRKIAVVLAVLAALFFGGKALGWWGSADDGAFKLYGNVEIREVQLGFRVGGRIERLLVDEGDKVTPGQVLAELDTRPLQDKLAQAEARLAGAAALASRDINGSRPQQIAEGFVLEFERLLLTLALLPTQAALSRSPSGPAPRRATPSRRPAYRRRPRHTGPRPA